MAEDESVWLDHDAACMRVALTEAEMAAREGHMPFGACVALTRDGTVVGRARNQCPAARQRGGSTGGATAVDVTRHAEMELVRQLGAVLSSSSGGDDADGAALPAIRRDELTLYTSTEPCVMCAGAIYWSGVGRLVYGCSARALEEQLSGPGGFDVAVRQLYGLASPGARTIRIAGPLLEEEALRVHDAAGVWPHSLPTKEQEHEDL